MANNWIFSIIKSQDMWKMCILIIIRVFGEVGLAICLAGDLLVVIRIRRKVCVRERKVKKKRLFGNIRFKKRKMKILKK